MASYLARASVLIDGTPRYAGEVFEAETTVELAAVLTAGLVAAANEDGTFPEAPPPPPIGACCGRRR